MPSERSRLEIDPERMRELGYRTVDALIDWIADESQPPLRRASPEEVIGRLTGAPTEAGEPFEGLLQTIFADVLPFSSRTSHPRYFAFVPAAGTWPGALGDFVASACNVYAGSWMESAGPSQLETEVLGWFKEWVGYPEEAAGSLVTGGSAANLTALSCARETLVGSMRDDLVVYASDQTHSSIARGARTLGFRPDQVRVLPVGQDLRLKPATLEAAMAVDEAAGRRPFVVVANAGATSAGAIDPLPEIAAICRARGAWLHVDAAYGGFAVLSERGRAALQGIELADSITLDPHKWLYQPYECGCLLVRDGRALRHAFEISSDYLRDADAAIREVNFADLGLQLTRTTRAFKLWLSLRMFGLEAFRSSIDRCLDLADLARDRIEASERLELAAPPSLGVVCFRRLPQPDEDDEWLTDGLVAALEQSGIGFISSTRVHGRPALRLCILNHTSGAEDVERVLAFLESAEPVPAPAGYDPHADVGESLPVFGRLEPAEAELLEELSSPRSAAAGDTVVAQWDTGRDFFVVVHGAVDVLIDGEVVATLRAGEFFGEIAALEWGAGFARSRIATVIARHDVELRVLPPDQLALLLDAFPRLEREIRRRAHDRLRELG
ncbi:MAG TPA: aminotransferase class I/II-fold pyridoxal phosphate-dependent enzyme [Gaiellaceae bacterium]|nr:aminotransferase class I/II-fold pyridoxal phosphate-dependent enzyme [Gaiellaceae bacterium]